MNDKYFTSRIPKSQVYRLAVDHNIRWVIVEPRTFFRKNYYQFSEKLHQ